MVLDQLQRFLLTSPYRRLLYPFTPVWLILILFGVIYATARRCAG